MELSGMACKLLADLAAGQSWLLGQLDLLAYLVGLVCRPRFLHDGWGDLNRPQEEQLKLEQQMLDGSPGIDLDSMIEWELGHVKTLEEGILTCRGSFLSLVSTSLPDEVKWCSFLAVSPGGELWEVGKEPQCVVIMLSATGEQSSFFRMKQALYLARTRGWSSLIVTAPFYAGRRPKGQVGHFLRTVEHILLQSLAAMSEAALLATWATKRFKRCSVCITGYSWGGAMAGIAGMMAVRWSERPSAIAAVPYVGCSSPAVLVDGIMSADICWEALRKGSAAGRYGALTLPTSEGGESLEVTRARLLQCLDSMRSPLLEQFVLPVPLKGGSPSVLSAPSVSVPSVPRSLGAVHVVTCHHDLIITKKYSTQLTDSMSRCCSADRLTVQWCSGGHVLAFLRRQSIQVNAILSAVDRVSYANSTLHKNDNDSSV
jgi:hypothetical protein